MQVLNLVILCIAMAVGSFIAGYAPIACSLPASYIKVMTTFGVGLLVGTCFLVIIPEGVHTIYASHHEDFNLAEHGVVGECHAPSSKYMGLAMALGFTMMLLLERAFGGEGHGHGHGEGRKDSESICPEDEDHENPAAAPKPSFGITSMLGILVHSAVDGIAFGAIAVSGDTALEGVVFLAIMMHKAPTAFGLTSLLMLGGNSSAQVLNFLALFSLTAPCAAILTYLLFSSTEWMGSDSDHSSLGLCLLFSAGTFMYTIAVHVLPEIQHKDGHATWSMILTLAAGIVAPYFVLAEHAH